MKVIDVSIEKLKPYERNPRKNEKAVEPVANSIRAFGFKSPIVVDKDYVVINGHTRLKAAKSLGLKTVPVIIADDLTPEEAKALRLADNRTAEIAEWDFNALDGELGDLEDFGIDMSGFGFDDMEDLPSADDYGTSFTLPSGEKSDIRQFTIYLHDEQAALFEACVDYINENGGPSMTFGNKNKTGNAVYEVMKQWAELKSLNLG